MRQHRGHVDKGAQLRADGILSQLYIGLSSNKVDDRWRKR